MCNTIRYKEKTREWLAKKIEKEKENEQEIGSFWTRMQGMQ